MNGSEKVLIAQERMASNHVAVYRKSQPSKYSHVAEMRCVCSGFSSRCKIRFYISVWCHVPAE